MSVLTDEITPLQNLDSVVYLYAPSYIFHSVRKNLFSDPNLDDNLSSIVNNATIVNCSSINSFNGSITINSDSQSNPNSENEYIYIAFPNFLNVS